MNIKEFREKLNEYFVSNEENEWVDISIVNINRMNIRIVSDKIENMDASTSWIDKVLSELNENMTNTNEKYILEYTNYHTIEDAKLFDIEKPIRRINNPSSFSDLTSNDMISKRKDKKYNSRVISFYSYKGGVGRTIALIQTAYLLAKEGKRVLLLDLDIEAPSFMNIFQNQHFNEFGMVDYLYESLYSNKHTLKLSDIISKLNLNVEGEIYILPAGKINKSYVNKLEKLKEKRIFENEYIDQVLIDAEKRFNIDYILVDSRTGINKWGALSLIDIADEVILFAYPNKENVEGLKLIIDLIRDNTKITVAFSRIDPSPRGKEIANDLFKDLNLKQEYISIYYNPEIALADEFPIKDKNILLTFKTLSDFILENETNEWNEKSIKSNTPLAKDILNRFMKINDVNEFTQNEMKVTENSNWLLIGEQNIFKDRILKILKNHIKDTEIITNENYSKRLKYVDFFKDTQDDTIISDFWWAYILCLVTENTSKHNFEEYYFDMQNTKDNLKRFCDIINSRHDLNPSIESYVILFLDLIKDIFQDFEDAVLNIILDSLLSMISTINDTQSKVHVKIFMDEKDYEKNEMLFDSYSSNMLNLDWKRLDDKSIERTILLQFFDMFSQRKFHDNIHNNTLEYINFFKSNQNVIEQDPFQSIRNIFALIFGKRVDKSIYSKEVLQWIHDELKKEDLLNPIAVSELIRTASKIELDHWDNKKEYDRIISIESLETAIKQISK
ncbi:AAA family ATPase [Lutibacter sp. B2]|nr:AAA family ATPase [Lutibacter sp. B2]